MTAVVGLRPRAGAEPRVRPRPGPVGHHAGGVRPGLPHAVGRGVGVAPPGVARALEGSVGYDVEGLAGVGVVQHPRGGRPWVGRPLGGLRAHEVFGAKPPEGGTPGERTVSGLPGGVWGEGVDGGGDGGEVRGPRGVALTVGGGGVGSPVVRSGVRWGGVVLLSLGMGLT